MFLNIWRRAFIVIGAMWLLAVAGVTVSMLHTRPIVTRDDCFIGSSGLATICGSPDEVRAAIQVVRDRPGSDSIGGAQRDTIIDTAILAARERAQCEARQQIIHDAGRWFLWPLLGLYLLGWSLAWIRTA